MKHQSMGSSFDNFLKEEGIYEEAVKAAKEKVRHLALQKERRNRKKHTAKKTRIHLHRKSKA